MRRFGRDVESLTSFAHERTVLDYIIHVGQTLYYRVRNFFSSGSNSNSDRDMVNKHPKKNVGWGTRIRTYLCRGLNSDTSVTEADKYQIKSPDSTEVNIGSAVPSGTELYGSEEDIEYFYPQPFFVIDDPISDSDIGFPVHKSVSENPM